MKITDALRGEHGAFYAQFNLLEDSLERATLPEMKAAGALLAAALAPHAHIENEILFPALEEQIGEGGPTRVLRMDHDEIEGSLARLANADDADAARRVVRDVLAAARDHFAKEENVLFPMAEQVLSERTLEDLGRQWAERRGVVLA